MTNEMTENGLTLTIPLEILELLSTALEKKDNITINLFIACLISNYDMYKLLKEFKE